MTLEHGLISGGRVVPGTDWIFRDSSAWYTEGDDDVYRRAQNIDLITYHWTAGPRRAGELAAQKTYRAMQARRNAAGEEMSVSAQFVLSDDGLLFQLADLNLCCVHADRQFNRRGIGVEYAFPGTAAQADKLSSGQEATVMRTVAGQQIRCVLPSPEALATAVRFSELMVRLVGMPRVAHVSRDRLLPHEMKSCVGVLEHFHAASTTKVDAGGFFVDAHAAAGWAQP